ncbi:unnamed protein product [Candida verbasci]|uniref:DUF3835 domain-containing protein n=1 Tax=Candida verbasci TaxID=1227364 RepID=A0A9W4XN04_9ASCO|nr:unnamed protein product [Candida verbasci]
MIASSTNKDTIIKNDKDEFDEINDQFDKTLQNLQRKKDLLSSQMNELSNMKQYLINLSSNDNKPVMIESEPGKMMKKTRNEAIEYIDEKYIELQSIYNDFDEKIKNANITKEKLHEFKDYITENENNTDQKLNEEGLPFMDIQEEFDDDGNITNVKINDKKQEIPLLPSNIAEEITGKIEDENHDNKSLIEIPSQTNNNIAPHDQTVGQIVDKNQDNNSSFNDSEMDELIKDMELFSTKNIQLDQEELSNRIDNLNISEQDKFNLKSLCVSEFQKLKDEENVLDGFQRGENQINLDLDKSNLIELELLADEFSNDDITENDNFNYDFEEEEDDFEEDDEEDDIADDLLYGATRNNMVGGNSEASNKLFWEQIQKLRDSKKSAIENPIESNKRAKTVRFAPNVQIKEVENVSEELKNIPVSNKMSLFKQQKYVNDRGSIDKVLSENKKDRTGGGGEIIEANIIEDIVEKDDENVNRIIEDEIIEKDKNIEDDINNSIESNIKEGGLKSVSRFKSMRLDQRHNLSRGFHNDKKHKLEDKSEEGENNNINDINIKETNVDYQNLQQDNDLMAKAYVLGIYDDDIITEGPVVDKLKDFEELNKIVEIRDKEISSEYDSNLNEIGMNEIGSNEIENDIDEPIMTDEIIENDLNDEDDDDYDYENDNDDDILNQEIRENYFKLRTKLISESNGYKKSENEIELEPIDEDGNPIKISRFKAGRFNKFGQI